jgi:hypothetical protein
MVLGVPFQLPSHRIIDEWHLLLHQSEICGASRNHDVSSGPARQLFTEWGGSDRSKISESPLATVEERREDLTPSKASYFDNTDSTV